MLVFVALEFCTFSRSDHRKDPTANGSVLHYSWKTEWMMPIDYKYNPTSYCKAIRIKSTFQDQTKCVDFNHYNRYDLWIWVKERMARGQVSIIRVDSTEFIYGIRFFQTSHSHWREPFAQTELFNISERGPFFCPSINLQMEKAKSVEMCYIHCVFTTVQPPNYNKVVSSQFFLLYIINIKNLSIAKKPPVNCKTSVLRHRWAGK